MAVMPAGKAVVICVPSLIHNRLALVERDIGTTDETGPTRGKKGHHGRDLVWFTLLNRGALPDRTVPPVTDQLARHVNRCRHRQDIDPAILVRSAADPFRCQSRGRALPQPPAPRGIQSGTIGAGAKGTELISGPHDLFEHGHHRGSMPPAPAILSHCDALNVSGPERAATVQQAPLNERRRMQHPGGPGSPTSCRYQGRPYGRCAARSRSLHPDQRTPPASPLPCQRHPPFGLPPKMPQDPLDRLSRKFTSTFDQYRNSTLAT